MKAFDKVRTQQLWEAIEHNARMGQRHLDWVQYLDNIRVLAALIDERTEAFQRRLRRNQLLAEHRGAFQLSGDAEGGDTSVEQGHGTRRAAASRKGGDPNGL